MCFSPAWIEQLLVWLIVVGAIVAIIRLLLPLIAAPLGPTVIAVINIALWACIASAVVYIVFGLLSCVAGGLPFHR